MNFFRIGSIWSEWININISFSYSGVKIWSNSDSSISDIIRYKLKIIFFNFLIFYKNDYDENQLFSK